MSSLLLTGAGPSGGGASWTPASITNLELFLQYNSAHCTSNTPGQPVSAVSASYGTTRTAAQALTLRPTFQSNGLSYDGGASQCMNLSSSLALLGAFTSYHVFNSPAGADCLNLGSAAGFSFLGFQSSAFAAQDDSFNLVSASPVPASGLILARVSGDGAGNVTITVTGNTPQSAGGFGTFTFDIIGAAIGAGPFFSGATANRSLLDIIKTGDNTGTAENTNILAWILTNYGAAL